MSLLKFVLERREKLHLRPVRCELMTKAWSRQAARKEMGNKTNGGGVTLVGEHRRVGGRWNSIGRAEWHEADGKGGDIRKC
jgi:hypothetical protein